MLPKHSSIISKWALGPLWNTSQSIRPGLPFWSNKPPSYPAISHAPPLAVLLPIFTPSLSLHTANTMTYYVFQLDSPWCLLSNSLAACELQSRLSIFHHDSWRINSKCLAGYQKQAEGTWREKRLLWIVILIFWLFTFISNIYHEKEYLFFFKYLQRGFWWIVVQSLYYLHLAC